MVIHLGEFIDHNILWLVPVITIFLGIMFRIFECYQKRIDYFRVFDFGLDLITSDIILLVTNHKSEVTVWLLLFFFIMCIIVLIVRQRSYDRYAHHTNLQGIIFTINIGIILLILAIMHIDSFRDIHIDYLEYTPIEWTR